MTKSALFVHHAANRGKRYPPSSILGLSQCLKAGARAIEMDIVPLADGDFALLHDQELEKDTDGVGVVSLTTAEQIQHLHYLSKGVATGESVGVLSKALALVAEYPHLQELQLDLKPNGILSDKVLMDLVRLVGPLKSKIRVTSPADWALRRLHVLDSEVRLGFDPLLYLDTKTRKGLPKGTPPFRIGAYGYRDDHPLSARVWGAASDYLAARAEVLRSQVPTNTMWYIRSSLLSSTRDDGFDWISYLHRCGDGVTAWTLNPSVISDVELACRLVSVGVDRIVSDDAPRLAGVVGGVVEF